jgi:hypothetical protein
VMKRRLEPSMALTVPLSSGLAWLSVGNTLAASRPRTSSRSKTCSSLVSAAQYLHRREAYSTPCICHLHAKPHASPGDPHEIHCWLPFLHAADALRGIV